MDISPNLRVAKVASGLLLCVFGSNLAANENAVLYPGNLNSPVENVLQSVSESSPQPAFG